MVNDALQIGTVSGHKKERCLKAISQEGVFVDNNKTWNLVEHHVEKLAIW